MGDGGAIMFCPRCGGDDFEGLHGGRCGSSCVYCGKAINCRCLFTDEVKIDSLPIYDPLDARRLRQEYDKISGNQERGEERLAENIAFHEKMAKQTAVMRSFACRSASLGTVRYKKFEGTAEEFLELLKKNKKQ